MIGKVAEANAKVTCKQFVMETIISIIVAIGILIFKVVAKNMEKSADKPVRPVRPVRPASMPEAFPQILEEVFDVPLESEEPKVESHVEPRVQMNVEPEVQEHVHPQIVRKATPVTIEQTSKDSEKKEKIDPKKLIIYSEIMNRKY